MLRITIYFPLNLYIVSFTDYLLYLAIPVFPIYLFPLHLAFTLSSLALLPVFKGKVTIFF